MLLRKFIIIVLITLLFGVLIGQWILSDRGYVLISYQGFFIETSLWFALGSLFILIALLLLIYRFLTFPWRLNEGLVMKKNRRAVTDLANNLLKFTGGESSKVYKSLRRSPWLENRLLAALAAFADENYEGAIRTARNLPRGRIAKRKATELLVDKARAFIIARAYVAQQEHQHALSSLKPFIADKKKNPQLSRLLKEIYMKTNQWKEFGELIAATELPEEEKLRDYELYFGKETHSGALDRHWNRLPKTMRRHPSLLSAYAMNLARTNTKKAEELLAAALMRKTDALLVDSYKKVQSDKPLHQLQFIEDLVLRRQDEESLIVAAAELALRNKLPNKAKDYYAHLIKMRRAKSADILAYARLLGESNNAADKKKAQELLHELVTDEHSLTRPVRNII